MKRGKLRPRPPTPPLPPAGLTRGTPTRSPVDTRTDLPAPRPNASPIALYKMQDIDNLQPKSMFFLEVKNPVRAFAVKVVFNKWFDRLFLTLIFFNCVFLSMDSLEPDFEDTLRGQGARVPSHRSQQSVPPILPSFLSLRLTR